MCTLRKLQLWKTSAQQQMSILSSSFVMARNEKSFCSVLPCQPLPLCLCLCSDISSQIYSFRICHHHNSSPPWLRWTNQSAANDIQLPSMSQHQAFKTWHLDVKLTVTDNGIVFIQPGRYKRQRKAYETDKRENREVKGRDTTLTSFPTTVHTQCVVVQQEIQMISSWQMKNVLVNICLSRIVLTGKIVNQLIPNRCANCEVAFNQM